MRSSILLATRWTLMAASLVLGGCGTLPASPSSPAPDPAASQLVLTTDTLLLTRPGEQTTVRAQAFNFSNEPVTAAVRWSSSNPNIPVDAQGRVTANVPSGSTVITAESGPARASVLVAVARTPEGAVTITDENLAAPITPADANASFGLGFRYTVPLKNPPAIKPGQVLINRGRTPVAGRVVQVQGDTVTLEVIPLDEVLPDIDIKAQLPVAMTPDALSQEMRNAFDVTHLPGGRVKFTQKQSSVLRSGGLRTLKSEYNLGPFQCESDGDAIAMDLSKTEFILTPDLKVDVEWTNERRKVVVRGQPTVSMEVKPTVSATLTGKIGCRLTLARPVVPLPGPLGLFLGASVPIGVGLEFEGKLPAVGFGIETKAEVGLKYALGIDCRQTCSNVAEADPIASGNITPKLPELPTGFVPEVSGYSFLFAKLEFGAHASERLRVESLEAQGGMKLETKLATDAHQAEHKPVAAEYRLVFEGVLGSGKDFEEFLDMVKVTTAKIEIKPRKELAWSPTGTVTLENPSYKKGDVVIFRLALDPNKVNFPLLRQNIKGFRIYLGEGSTPSGAC
ncbi:hypothetical protein ACFSC4_16100 [Deinococcus malanensis]|uniref:hypothetical protein n=1 Tax=Deinococcus malanensis TaxID=1706855 RepID=UPI003631CAF8